VVATSTGVNISNLTVDGSNNNLNGAGYLAGIFYQAGSSGMVNEVTTRNQIEAVQGTGIWIENGTSTPESITVQNSSVHDVDFAGIFTDGSNLTANVKGNSVRGGYYGLLSYAQSGLVTGNVITASTVALRAGGSATFSGNTILDASSVGIFIETGTNILMGNKIFHSGLAILLLANGQTVQSNVITNSNIAIYLDCLTGNVISRNTINDAISGLYYAPSTFTGANTFLNVDTVRSDGCPAGQTKPAALAFPTPLMRRTR
jgi:hypothetical protein